MSLRAKISNVEADCCGLLLPRQRQARTTAPGSLLVLIIVILMTNVAGNPAYVRSSRATASLLPPSLIRAQCKTFCLRKFYTQFESVQSSSPANDDLHSWCSEDPSCSNCYAGCEAQISDSCAPYCLNSNAAARSATLDLRVCNESCKLVQSLFFSPPTYNWNLPFARINDPRETSIETISDGVITRESALDIEWALPERSNMSRPVLFILEARFCIGPVFDDDCASPWRLLTLTTKLGAEMSDVKIGWRYQFRLAAVSAEGTRGFRPTAAVGLQAEPRPPKPPENVAEVRTTLRGSKVDVEIRWDPPRESDLDVYKYRVFWSKKLDDIPLVLSSKEYSKATVRNENSYVIEDLDPEAVYSVAVQAISLYGNLELQSTRATTYISTLAIASVNDTRRNGSVNGQKQLFPIIVNQTYYEDEELRAIISWPMANTKVNILRFHVSWKPIACIGEPAVPTKPLVSMPTTYRFAVLHKLIFDCRYEVVVRPMTADDRQLIPSVATFDTPSCAKVQGRYGRKPKCSDSRHPPAISSFTSRFIHVDSNKYAANITWRPQARTINDISNYRIVWGRDSRPVSSMHILPFRNLTLLFKDSTMSIDKNDAITKVVPRNATWLLISELEENVVYIVTITPVSLQLGDGPKSQLQFIKPFNSSFTLLTDTGNGLVGNLETKGGKSNSTPNVKRSENNQMQPQISSATNQAAPLLANMLLAFLLSAVAQISAFVLR